MANVKVKTAHGLTVMSDSAIQAEFQSFWAVYPRRVAPKAALKAYIKARGEATAEDILSGVERYIRHKPGYCDYAHASSWLNAGRYFDEYETPKPRSHPVEEDDYHVWRERQRAMREGQTQGRGEQG